MRGEDLRQGAMFSYISLEERIPSCRRSQALSAERSLRRMSRFLSLAAFDLPALGNRRPGAAKAINHNRTRTANGPSLTGEARTRNSTKLPGS